LHGICSTGRVFRGVGGRGLFQLLSRDFRPFVGELTVGRPGVGLARETTLASGPGGASCPPGFDFDRHLSHDLPRIWREFQQFAPEGGLVLGYSMGGMLAAAAQACGIFKARRLMLLGSPFTFPGVPFFPALMRFVLRCSGPLGLRRIPIRLAARLLYWYFSYVRREPKNPNLDIFHSLGRTAAADVSRATLAQAVRWVESGRWLNADGTHEYLDDLHKITVPTLLVAGEKDRIAPEVAVLAGYHAISSPHKHFVTIPQARHIDLVAGPCLPQVWKLARSWFAAP
jgi:pimeloyl-ACP methyl ester carboxylesterase